MECSRVLLGVLIFLLSPSFNNLISNFAFWNAKEQFLYLTGSIAIVYMVICMLLSAMTVLICVSVLKL